jgi:hypothetical protein
MVGPTYSNPHDPPVPNGATAAYIANIYGGAADVYTNTGGWSACAGGNIQYGLGGMVNTAAVMVDGCMADQGNDLTLGHRRGVLHPRLTKTAFGFCFGNDGFNDVWNYVMQVAERPYFTAPEPPFDFVAHPAQGWYPTQCFNSSVTLWSFSANPAKYDMDALTTVTVHRVSDGQDLGVTADMKLPGFGITPTISFEPLEATLNETYRVTVRGIYERATDRRIAYRYTVTFFDPTQ